MKDIKLNRLTLSITALLIFSVGILTTPLFADSEMDNTVQSSDYESYVNTEYENYDLSHNMEASNIESSDNVTYPDDYYYESAESITTFSDP